MAHDVNRPASQDAENTKSENSSLDRRELVRRLGKAAILPAVVASFLANDVTDAAAY
jgi:hypothetical protein